MYGVYEVLTWDDVTYTKLSEHQSLFDAERECERLKKDRKSKHFNPDPITYRVMDSVEYYNLMLEHDPGRSFWCL